MTKYIKILMFVVAAQTMFASPAFALSKLSSTIRRVKSYLVVAQDYANSAQEQVNGVMYEANTYIRKAKSGEFAEMAEKQAVGEAKAYAEKYAKSYADEYKKKAEQYAKGQIEKYQAKKKKKDLEKAEEELAAKQAEMGDYEEAVKDAKIDKNRQIDEELVQLKLKIQDENLSEDEYNDIKEKIAVLEAQKQDDMSVPLNDETYKGLQEDVEKKTQEVEEKKKEAEEAELQEKAAQGTEEVFDEKEEIKENIKTLYESEIEALFLKENETSSSENLARIKKNRNREYYNALQKAMEVATVGTAASADMEKNVNKYAEMAAEVDGNYALKNASIALVIANAKTAARFTEALLAEIRLKTTKDMASWNNKNHLYDYGKPVTEFDFDSYALKKTDLKDKVKTFYNERKDKINDFYDKNKDTINNMWHKI